MRSADTWLKTFLTTGVFTRGVYQTGHTLVIVTWDESDQPAGTGCGGNACWYKNCASPSVWLSTASCRIGTLLISPYDSGGVHVPTAGEAPAPLYSQDSIARLVQKTFGLRAFTEPSPAPPFWASYQSAVPFPG